MVNYILVYKIRKQVKEILKEKIEDGEIATTPRSCLGCLADEISWEVYYLFKEMEEKKKGGQRPAKGKAGGFEGQPDENLEAGLKTEVDEEAAPQTEQETGPSRAEKINDKK
jgi:hypothetical protein